MNNNHEPAQKIDLLDADLNAFKSQIAATTAAFGETDANDYDYSETGAENWIRGNVRGRQLGIEVLDVLRGTLAAASLAENASLDEIVLLNQVLLYTVAAINELSGVAQERREPIAESATI